MLVRRNIYPYTAPVKKLQDKRPAGPSRERLAQDSSGQWAWIETQKIIKYLRATAEGRLTAERPRIRRSLTPQRATQNKTDYPFGANNLPDRTTAPASGSRAHTGPNREIRAPIKWGFLRVSLKRPFGYFSCVRKVTRRPGAGPRGYE